MWERMMFSDAIYQNIVIVIIILLIIIYTIKNQDFFIQNSFDNIHKFSVFVWLQLICWHQDKHTFPVTVIVDKILINITKSS